MTTAQFPDEQVDGAFRAARGRVHQLVRADGSTDYPAVAGRYHLYVSLACPWAHRTIIVRSLKKLEDAIGMTVVDPIRDDRGWPSIPAPAWVPIRSTAFTSSPRPTPRPIPVTRRVTVPVLWDKHSKAHRQQQRRPHHAYAARSSSTPLPAATISIFIPKRTAARSTP